MLLKESFFMKWNPSSGSTVVSWLIKLSVKEQKRPHRRRVAENHDV